MPIGFRGLDVLYHCVKALAEYVDRLLMLCGKINNIRGGEDGICKTLDFVGLKLNVTWATLSFSLLPMKCHYPFISLLIVRPTIVIPGYTT